MEKVERQGDGCCVGGLLLATALLPPPISPPRGRRRWGRPTVPGRPCCRRGASRSWRGDSTASFITWVGGFLTVAHVVPKRLLVARELNSKLGVPSALGSFGLQVLAHWEGALGSTSTSGQRHTWRSQGRSPYHTTCREKQRKEWIHTPSDVGPNPFISTKKYRVTRNSG